MVTQLGQTSDPSALIPGNPGAIATVAGNLYDYATLLSRAGNGLARIDTKGGWQGEAADAFRKRFHGHPGAWIEAGACFSAAAKALDDYVPVLAWAQKQAAEAIAQWNEGDKQGAQTTLGTARGRVASAAATAVGIIGRARDEAPHKPGFWSKVGDFLSGAAHDAEEVGAGVLNTLASTGNAIIQHPGDDAAFLGGLLLAGVSASADAAGGVLDLGVVTIPVGAAINVAYTAGVLAGGGIMYAAARDLGGHAAGDDRVDPVQVGDDSGAGPPRDPRLTPGTQEYDDYINELSKDPAKNGKISGGSQREATVAAQAEADGDLPGPLTRTPLKADGDDDGDFTDGAGQKWEVKSSPDIKPDYSKEAGQPIDRPQDDAKFAYMINKELNVNGQNVLLDPHGMSATRLAHLQELVAEHPEWQGKVTWGR